MCITTILNLLNTKFFIYFCSLLSSTTESARALKYMLIKSEYIYIYIHRNRRKEMENNKFNLKVRVYEKN